MSVDTHQTPKPKCLSKGQHTITRDCCTVGERRGAASALQTRSYLVLLVQGSWAVRAKEILLIEVFVFNVYRLCLPLLLVFKKDSSELFDIYPTHKVDAGKKAHSFLVIPLNSIRHQPSCWQLEGGCLVRSRTSEYSTASIQVLHRTLPCWTGLILPKTSHKESWGWKQISPLLVVSSIFNFKYGEMPHICHNYSTTGQI